MKRWTDVQHALFMAATDDGLMVTTYRSKRKERPFLWAALRLGFGAGDWVAPFSQACDEAGLPKADFLVLRPSVDLVSFTRHPAGWADANRAFHALLLIAGMPVDDVVRYTMHSLPHVYPTCGFQLMFPPPAVTLMGHWATKADRMASVYDATRVSTELAYKANIAANVHAGWRPVSDGTIPRLLLVPLGRVGPPTSLPEPPKKKKKMTEDTGNVTPLLLPEHGGADAQAELQTSYCLPKGVLRVMNNKSKLVHLYSPKTRSVACSAWDAGTPTVPTKSAEFVSMAVLWDAKRHAVRCCLSCQSLQAVKRLGGTIRIGDEEIAGSDTSASETSSCSSSS